MAKKPVVKKAP